ncbi:MAG TPA: hypothetical protein VNU68_23025, partial [Verrucomicrobiae bacterium]|nr:hypothetical protein [Verrucomicrobiae bacterium]
MAARAQIDVTGFTRRQTRRAEDEELLSILVANPELFFIWGQGRCIPKLLVILLDYRFGVVSKSGRGHGNRIARAPDFRSRDE